MKTIMTTTTTKTTTPFKGQTLQITRSNRLFSTTRNLRFTKLIVPIVVILFRMGLSSSSSSSSSLKIFVHGFTSPQYMTRQYHIQQQSQVKKHDHSVLLAQLQLTQQQQKLQITGRRTMSSSSTILFAEDNKKGGGGGRLQKTKGVYVRPSGAIERGSGFFVPGLEGPRVRLVFGSILLLLTYLNHVLAMNTTTNNNQSYLSLEESIAIIYSLLVLFQAAIEFGKEELIIESNSSSSSSSSSSSTTGGASTNNKNNKELIQKWNMNSVSSTFVSEESKSRIQWAAASYIAVTPATQMLLLQKDSIIYQLGNDLQQQQQQESSLSNNNNSNDTTIMINEEKAVKAALEQLQTSKGGRIALPPSTHPAVTFLGFNNVPRTVVLQRITDDTCWMMSSSDQLLASFTSSDLKWLGQLANYVAVAVVVASDV